MLGRTPISLNQKSTMYIANEDGKRLDAKRVLYRLRVSNNTLKIDLVITG